MKIDHFITDADGVIIDSQEIAWEIAYKIVALFNNEVAPFQNTSQFKKYFGRFAQEDLVGKEEAEVLRAMHRLLMRHNAQRIKCFENVIRIISEIRVKKTIVTSALSSGIREILKEKATIFNTIIGREENKKSVILRNICKGSEIYITDSCRDINICKEINLSVIGVGWGYESSSELMKLSPDYFVNSPYELKELLEKLKLV